MTSFCVLFIVCSDHLIVSFYPLKKVGPPLIRVEKKFLRNWAYRVSKEAEFYADFKMCRSLAFGKKKKSLGTS
jgi:hypothetical protein